MSNQGWAPPPRKNRTATDKVLDTLFWPFKKVFHLITNRLLLKYSSKE
jgi:hypothetical protein